MKEVVVGIISRDGKVLSCQRKKDAVYPLKWEFPGGKIEHGESPQEALRRELLEELAIHATIGEEFHRQEWVYSDSTGNGGGDGRFRVTYFRIASFEGEPSNRVFEQMRWVSVQELLTMDILEGNKEAITLLEHDSATRSNPEH